MAESGDLQPVGHAQPGGRPGTSRPLLPLPLRTLYPPIRLHQLAEIVLSDRERVLAGDRDPDALRDGGRDGFYAGALGRQMRRALMPSVPNCSKKPGKLFETQSGSLMMIP